jgi:integrase/recombinase XerD
VADDHLDAYLKACEARGLQPGTLDYRRLYLRHFMDWLRERGIADVRCVNGETIAGYARELQAHRYRRRKTASWRLLAARTRAQRLGVVHGFFRWLCGRRVLLADPTSGLAGKPLPKVLPVGVPSESEVMRLIEAADPARSAGRRNRAILELFYSTGMRLAELEALDLSDLDLTSGTVLVRSGKGGRSRVVPLGEAAAEALLDYIQNVRPQFLRRLGIPALFLASTTGHRLTKKAIWQMMHEISRTAGFEAPVTPHQLRHACATHMLRAGCDIRHVQAILGHVKLETTEIYTHVAIRDLAAVHARTHPRCCMKQHP